MKRILLILPLLILLSSCQDMFNKMIEYKGSEEPQVLCLNTELVVGKPLKVYLTHSWFFLDRDRFVDNYYTTRRGIVSDASVQLSINGGEWQPLTFISVPDTIIRESRIEGASYYTTDLTFAPGDSITLRATHPSYPTVTTSEVVPVTPSFTIDNVERLGDKKQVIAATFHSDAMDVHPGDVMFLWLEYTGGVDTSYQYQSAWYGDGRHYTDTIIVYRRFTTRLNYSDDFMFSEYSLPRTDHGYYVQNGMLYTTAEHFLKERQVRLLLDLSSYRVTVEELWSDTLGHITAERDSMRNAVLAEVGEPVCTATMRLATESFYWYRTTLFGGTGASSYAPEISLYRNSGSSQGGGDYGYSDFSVTDIFEEVSGAFSELGIQESVQIYTNVDGGFGHFSILTLQTIPVPLD